MTDSNWTAAQVINAQGKGPWLLVCEHASNEIPPEFNGLGLEDDAATSHAAWDIGALDLAKALAENLDAPLVAGGISRLVYDCNRPLTAPDCIPARSEIYDIPGNAALTDADRQARFDRIHTPFHDAVTAQQVASGPQVLVTIHSFTPVFNGMTREVELGFLYHDNPELAQALLAREQSANRFRSALNEPYAAADGVTYTLKKHGEGQGLPAVMIEVRNDLIDTPAKAQEMAEHLAESLRAARAATDRKAAE
jgi:predicted N-formylglutamate amidohydrolase